MKQVLSIILIFSLLLITLSGCSDEPAYIEENGNEEETSAGHDFGNFFDDVDEYEYQFGKNPEYQEDAVTVAFRGGADLYSLIMNCMESGMHVNVVEYPLSDHFDAINLKLLSEDPDIDVFYTQSIDIYTYMTTQFYDDLSQYDELKTRIESNDFVKYVASYNGTYFGVPLDSYYYDTATNEKNDTITKYLVKNLSALDGTFLDTDGEELYEVLRHTYDHPDDPRDSALYPDTEVQMVRGEFLVMNPFSNNKEAAVEFLAKCLDFLTGEAEVTWGQIYHSYVELDDYENVELYWDFRPYSIIEPILNAYNSCSETDGSDDALRELAEDAANQVNMRLKG